jgi:hypothetical protein
MWPWAVVAASLLPAAAFGLLQLREGAAVDRYLRSRGVAGLPVNRATALQVSHAVRADFEVDPTKWKALDYGRRPFLRRDTESLLRVREGECGQGTRVLVNLLERLGFDATRLTLYDTHLQSAHTLVSIRLAEGELLVDSINTPAEMNAFLDRAGLSTQDFLLLHYTDDIESRHRFARELAARDTGAVDSTRTAFFDRYRVYSYEALPLTKLLTRAGVDVRVFNLARPARWISSLAEKPRAILGVMCLALALAFDAALLLALRARDRAASRA